jgi:signal peptidase I
MSPFAVLFDEAHAVKCELAAEVLRASGTLHFRATGWSMLPAIRPGDLLTVERVDGEIGEGEVILFSRDRRLFAHRVIAGEQNSVTTRGDTMAAPDSPVSREEVLGRVVSILRNGKKIRPDRGSSLRDRAVAGMMRRSNFAARVAARVHNFISD